MLLSTKTKRESVSETIGGSEKGLRIVYMLPEDLNRTGSGIVHFMAVAKGLRKRGHDVSILAPQYSGKMFRPKGFHNILVPLPGRNMVTYLLFQVLAAILMPLIWLLHRPHALMVRGGWGLGFLVYLAARAMGIRVAVEVNGIPWVEMGSRGLSGVTQAFARKTAAWECRTANRIIAVTPMIAQELIRVSGKNPAEVFAIQNGADPEEFARDNRQPKRSALKLASDKMIVGFVGDFSPWHGTRQIIESASLLPETIRRQVQYVLVGAGEGWEEARHQVHAAHLDDVIALPGFARRNLLKDYLAVFDVGLHVEGSYKRGQFGSSALKFWEYLAAGLPVIVSDDINLTRIVQADNMGLVIPDTNPETIAKAVTDVFSRREEFRSIGEQNRRVLRDKYSWDVVAGTVARVLAGEPVPHACCAIREGKNE
ncbi:MAG TPA: hypothetical protein DCX07_08695 [Phycisphaerales bacterium]|nr:hypothetical protein [Phycisphaerales bacterium]